MDRRGLLVGTAALGATSLLSARALAQAKTLVAATFPGTSPRRSAVPPAPR